MAIGRLTQTGVNLGTDYHARIMLRGSGLSAVKAGNIIQGDDTTGGAGLVAMALADYKDANTYIAMLTEGTVLLSVTGKTGAGVNQAIKEGDFLFLNASSDRIDKGPGTVCLGTALESVVSGATTVIQVHFDPATAQTIASDTTIWNKAVYVPALTGISSTSVKLVDTWTPGYAGTILKMWYEAAVAASTSSKDVDLAWKVGATQTTGGLLTLLTADINAVGKVKAATALTGGNTFTDTDTLSLCCVECTAAFSEGAGTVHTLFSFAHDHV